MPQALDELLKQPSEWLRGVGPTSDIVMSSRIRLARNFEKLPFATRATKTSQAEVLKIAKDGITRSTTLMLPVIFDMSNLDEVDRQFLVERHLVSRELIVQPEYKAVRIRVYCTGTRKSGKPCTEVVAMRIDPLQEPSGLAVKCAVCGTEKVFG